MNFIKTPVVPESTLFFNGDDVNIASFVRHALIMSL